MQKTVLIILHPEFEEIEAITPIDLLRRAGFQVITASTSDSHSVTSRGAITLRADSLLSDNLDSVFDALVIPGGPGIFNIRSDERIKSMLEEHRAYKKLIACICAAPLLLLDLGYNKDIPMTCHPSVEDAFKNRQAVGTLKHETFITSRGAGTAIEFSLSIIEALTDRATAARIAKEIAL